MSENLISLTGLAKMHHTTTPIMRQRLTEQGVKPAQEAAMPSGRTFLVFNKDVALAALERAKKAKEAEKAAKVVETPKPAVEASKGDIDVAKMAKELEEVKDLMKQILDTFTKPEKAAK